MIKSYLKYDFYFQLVALISAIILIVLAEQYASVFEFFIPVFLLGGVQILSNVIRWVLKINKGILFYIYNFLLAVLILFTILVINDLYLWKDGNELHYFFTLIFLGPTMAILFLVTCYVQMKKN